jgi:ubiquinone/menaquinone biosynthesis C-methylase UbiE
MSSVKTDKEMAFLHDLFVAPDWGERFAQLIDENVTLPNKGRALYLGSGTGSHVLALAERGGQKLSFVCVEEHEEYLEIARSKAAVENVAVEFRLGSIDQLSFVEDEFDIVIGDGSLVSPARVVSMLKEMVRVARPGATVAFVLTTASSFGEFFSIYWEVLHNCGLEHETNVANLISELQSVSEIEEAAETFGLDGVTSVSRIEEFHYDTGDQFVNSPLVADFLMKHWIESLAENDRTQVVAEIPRLVDDDRQQADFMFSVKATLVSGRKAQTH